MTKKFCDRCQEEQKSTMMEVGHVTGREKTLGGKVFWESKELCGNCFQDYKSFLHNNDVQGRYMHETKTL